MSFAILLLPPFNFNAAIGITALHHIKKEKQYWWQLVYFRSVSPDPSFRDPFHWMLINNRYRVQVKPPC